MLNIKVGSKTGATEKRIHESLVRFRKGIQNGTKLSGRAIQKKATMLLSTGSRTGVHYKALPNRSSAKGEYPRSQSGRLLRSIYYNTSGYDSFSVGSTEKHGAYLEHGTKLMSARPTKKKPWLQKAMKLEERNIENYLKKEVLKELKR